MSHNMRAVCRGLILTGCGLASIAAGDPLSVPAMGSEPMAISSGRMTVKNLDHRVVFDDNVTITKGDMDLSADRVEIYLSGTADASAGKQAFAAEAGPNVLAEENIERIEAMGGVKVVQGKKTATADRAVYYRAQETIVLTGHPETREEGVRIQGSKITILLKEQRSIVEQSRVVIYPEADAETGSGSPPTPQTADGG